MHPVIRICFLQAIVLTSSVQITPAVPLPCSDIGRQAQKLSGGRGSGIADLWNGYKLECSMQALGAEVTMNGVLFLSTSESEGKGPFSLRASRLGRNGNLRSLPSTVDRVSRSGEIIRCNRSRITEEYSTSADGIRQDFILTRRPAGKGKPTLELELSNAAAASGSTSSRVSIRLACGRLLTYHSLNVTDRRGKKLPAFFESSGTDIIRITFDDSRASYPIRVDPTITDANWSGVGQAGGFDRNNGQSPGINSLAFDTEGNLHVGGMFDFAGGVPAANIAKWNGSEWSQLGNGLHSQYAVVQSIIFDAGGNLFAGGRFDSAGTVSARSVAKWDGSGWSPVGKGISGYVNVLAEGISGEIYAVGAFDSAGTKAARHAAKWNGSEWQALGSGINGTGISTCAIGSDGALFVGGRFDTAGAVAVNNIAKWDGTAWSGLDSGIDGPTGTYPWVASLLADNAGNLYAAGKFTTAGQVSTRGVARWDGTSWSAVSNGVNGDITELARDSSGNLYATGDIDTAVGTDRKRIVKWNDTAWSEIECNRYVSAMTFDLQGTLYTSTAGSVFMLRENDGWSELLPQTGTGFNGPVHAIVVDHDGSTFVGGAFTRIGLKRARFIAKWDGSSWNEIGGGTNNQVHSLTVDHEGNLYAGGRFDTAGTVPAHGIAKWDGNDWSALGEGVYGAPVTIWGIIGTVDPMGPVPIGTDSIGRVFALDVDESNHIIAGGIFDTAGTVPAKNIALWDGTTWSAFGNGLSSSAVTHTESRVVYTLAGATDGAIYAGGFFDSSGTVPLRNIARWDGTSWSEVKGGMNSTVAALALDASEHLYAGGGFDSAGTQPIRHIARLDENGWSALGNGTDSGVYAITFDSSGTLFAGGMFDSAGMQPARHIAMWNRDTWAPLGSGTNDMVSALCMEGMNWICTGGSFTVAGGKVSSCFARCILDASDVQRRPSPIGAAATLNFDQKRNFFIIQLIKRSEVGFRLFTLSGREVHRSLQTLSAGMHRWRLPDMTLSCGTYIAQVNTGHESLRCGFMVKR
ncbi:MAG: hypothetical protein JW863_06255 [Chitinispirillaceae bacterium]|nr:hypothetical protein [Chitinispirillaceae bacterium]